MRLFISVVLVAALALSTGLIGCESNKQTDPKQTVIALFGAMEKDDKAALTRILDLAELMQTINEDYALQTNNPRTFSNPQEILDDLTGEGKTKQTWFSLQRIINTTDIQGDVATVEVTFVDKERSRGYMTRFGLHKKNDKWRIYSFKMMNE
ncbi:hypothetical protein GF356_00200 [candidate division GN15 bacterium]|nr:hypothetical protein [candidate division GN15 bacterium]